MKSFRIFLTVFLPLLVFGVLYVTVVFNNIQGFDTSVYSVVSKMISEKMTSFMRAVSFFASGLFLSSASVVFIPGIFIKKRKYSFYSAIIILNIALSSLVNVGLKWMINRVRPDILQLTEVSGLSFPSGHSMAAACFYGFFIYLCCRYLKSGYKIAVTAVLAALICLIGLSRIYLGVHYASDVLGGFSFGVFWIGAITLIIEKLQEKYARAAGK
ncbi:undecaprenyl pyrophosphate phosphatase [Ruminiclostridium hungatei]|uniref:Undecaprenyl pyrophosphate phosphatase n=1 Tax=Ruminiclostridium hungatei TaxID=48256 RepID=A0A1V4SDR2_RUMHU|nr:phosphatase PAP2 family protein [Ruminiclostridium hungatei]OPX41988.1 undecaprenyl pyrophosphate phosphatase [Ruminiclostridium hungatei]